VNIERLAARSEVLHAYASHELAAQILGAKAEVSLEEGVRRMAEWARRAGPRTGARFGKIEVEKNLPDSWRSIL
jgi:UDP-glucose 4-epimerase